MIKKKLFLASSAELSKDRKEFEIFINRKNKDWVAKGVFIELVLWEDFLDAVSRTRLQDEYNKAIAECDIFVMLFWTKVGKYTAEELERAFKQFKATEKLFIFTYFGGGAGETSPAACSAVARYSGCNRIGCVANRCSRNPQVSAKRTWLTQPVTLASNSAKEIRPAWYASRLRSNRRVNFTLVTKLQIRNQEAGL